MTIYGEVLDMVLGAIVKAHGVGQTAQCSRHLRHLAVVLIVDSPFHSTTRCLCPFHISDPYAHVRCSHSSIDRAVPPHSSIWGGT